MRAGAPLLALALAGCAGASVDRWSKVEGLPPYAPPVLTVSSAPAPSADSTSAKALPERAEAAYVAAVAAKEKSTKDLRAALAKPIEEAKAATKDATITSRVLVVGVERETPRPGDRLLSTIVSIRPAEHFRFVGYQQAATDRTFIDIGQVSITDQQSASVAGGSASATAKLEASRSRSASRAIRGESDLTVDVSPDLIRIYRTGVEGRDLTGDTLVKLSIRLPQDDARERALAEANLRDDQGAPTPADKLQVKLKFVSMVPARDLWVCARLAYEDRAIVDGARSYDEGRQSVALKTGETPWTPYLIAAAEELETPLWVVMDSSGGSVGFKDRLQHVSTLTFDDYDGAVAFLDWVQHARTDQLANGSLVRDVGDRPAVSNFAGLYVDKLPQTRGASVAPMCS